MSDERIDAIRERLAAATPGPWAWRGYTDGSIELRTVGRGGQRVVTSHRSEPCLVELLDGSIALTFYACDSCQVEAKKSQDPWVDYRCPKDANLDTVWLRDAEAGFIRPANHWAVAEVSYRTDVAEVAHPDAALIANAPTDIAYLLERLEQVEASEARLRDAALEVGPTCRNYADGCLAHVPDRRDYWCGGCTLAEALGAVGVSSEGGPQQ